MDKRDMPRFAAAVAQLCAVFSKDPEPALAEGYYAALEDLPIDVVVSAMERAVKTSEFFPRPVHLRELAGGRSSRERAQEAWVETLILARNSRAAKHPDATAEAVIKKLGGWSRLGALDTNRLDRVQRDFLELYEAEARRQTSLAAPARKELTA
jgi:hypothetical protein